MESEFKKKEDNNLKEIEPSPEKFNEFGREQLICSCQYCYRKVLTDIEHQTTWIGTGLSILLFIILRLYSIPLIVMLIPLTQQTVHSCPNCLNKLGISSFYDSISLSDKVITYSVGNFGIIITKKQIFATFIFLLFAIIFYVFYFKLSIFGRGNFIQESWQDFKFECLRENISNNIDNRLTNCKSKYKYSDVMWKGFVIRIDYIEDFLAKFRINILIKMENNKEEEADIYLKFTEYEYDKFKSEIFNITRGDYVSFNATIIFEGDHKHKPVLETIGFEKLHDHIYIEPHIHYKGRYAVPHENVIHKDNLIYREIPNLVSDEEKTVEQLENFH